jgi:hypothetical protein
LILRGVFGGIVLLYPLDANGTPSTSARCNLYRNCFVAEQSASPLLVGDPDLTKCYALIGLPGEWLFFLCFGWGSSVPNLVIVVAGRNATQAQDVQKAWVTRLFVLTGKFSTKNGK